MREYGSFDYVIVGAGSAGCVLANRLSADPDIRVCLLEAGGEDNYPWIHVPVGYLKCIGNPRTDWMFKTVEEPGLNGRSLGYPRGLGLGGCSSINGMLYLRGQANDYQTWRQLGCEGWGWDDVLPYFKKSEDYYAGGDDLHGAEGEWRVEEQRLSWEILGAVQDAAEEIGIPKIDDFNSGDNFGSSHFHVNQKRGIRWSTAKGFLKPVRDRTNLKVLTGAHAQEIQFDGNRVTGVAIERNGEKGLVEAEGEVILASGAVGSPQLLQLSGIGPADLLQSHGISVRHAHAGVGGNLQDHLQLRMIFKVQNVKTLNTIANTLVGRLKIGLEYLVKRSGPLSMAPSQLGIFARTDDSFETPNVEFHVQPLSLDKFGDPLHAFPAITPSVCNLRPESRGTIQITSPDPKAKPEIRPNYLSTDGDRRVAADSLRLARRIMAADKMKKYEPSEYLPGDGLQSEDDLVRAAGDIGTTIFHPVGTAKMGAGDDAVVNPRLKVNGFDGLRVIDASVMPTITSGNTNSPTIMIAEKGADMIREDRRAGH